MARKRKNEKLTVMTFQEIGDILGISKQRVERIEKSALKKLRANPKAKEILETFQEIERI